MVKSAAKRTLKYSVKDDPWVIAMRYKRFMQKYATPILTAQMEADNIDAEIETILEKCGYSRLNRFNALTFLRSLPKIVGQYQNPEEAQFMLDRITELGAELGLKGDQVVCLLMALRAKFVKEGFVGAAVSERVRIYTKLGQLPRGQNVIAERVFCNTTFPTSGEFLIEAANSSLGIPVSLAVL